MAWTGYVYRIIAPGSNSVYVGQSEDPLKRFARHKGSKGAKTNPKLSNWLKKHSDAEIYFWPAEDMNAAEIAEEQECLTLGYELLNLVPCGGKPPKRYGKRSTEACAKISAAKMGHRHSEDTKAKIRAAKLANPTTTSFSAGHAVPQEWRDRWSAKLKGRPWSAARREAQNRRAA